MRVVRFMDRERLKAEIQRIWKEILQEEIQARIREMLERCEKLIKTGGKRIKTALW